MTRKLLVAFLVVTIHAPALAADRQKIRVANVGIQAVMTIVSGVAQGKVRSARDVWRCLGAGSVAGYGFYEAKAQVGRGNVHAGWLIANAATSLSENAAAGRNPIAQLGYSIGPLRIRVPIARFDPEADSHVYVDANVYEAVSIVRAYRDNDRMTFRSGLIAFERDSLYPSDIENSITVGRTYGMFPGLSPRADESTWPHEVIHAVQSLQAGSVEPQLAILTYKPAPRDRKTILRFEHLRLGAVNIANDQLLAKQAYHERWVEIEAFRLSEDAAPPRF